MKTIRIAPARLAPLLLAVAGTVHAQAVGQKMYKCLVDGRTVYQQTACPANAVDAKKAAAASAASAGAGTAAPPPAASAPVATGAASTAQR